MSLPGADELFRATGDNGPGQPPSVPVEEAAKAEAEAAPPRVRRRGGEGPSGRERHDEKITVYCSAEELLALEHARLTLRADHGLAVDRGRIVREAVSVVLADLAAKGDGAILVRRLRAR
ncbi:MAG: hypothetical protein ACYCO3_09110 [Mycobacteriales bacterium]